MTPTSAHPDSDTPTELDDAFEALAHPKRRAVLAVLQERKEVTLEELATAIAGDGQSLSNVKIELVHHHLPQLADVGVVSYDANYVCELDPNETLLGILETARSLAACATQS